MVLPRTAPEPSNHDLVYLTFPTPGLDTYNFLNALFSIFARAATQSGAPVGTMGPLAYSLGGFPPHFQ